MVREENITGMKDMLQDPDRTYQGLIRNIYSQSQVLSVKYR